MLPLIIALIDCHQGNYEGNSNLANGIFFGEKD
jgi:hypothetical protein